MIFHLCLSLFFGQFFSLLDQYLPLNFSRSVFIWERLSKASSSFQKASRSLPWLCHIHELTHPLAFLSDFSYVYEFVIRIRFWSFKGIFEFPKVFNICDAIFNVNCQLVFINITFLYLVQALNKSIIRLFNLKRITWSPFMFNIVSAATEVI